MRLKKFFNPYWVTFLIFVQGLLIPAPMWASPMFAPTKEEAFRSPLIVIGEYQGYKPRGEINYFRGPIARYKVIEVMKGSPMSKILDVRYDFQDGSACLAPEGEKFTKDWMPPVGSRWVLFLNKDKGEMYFSTYRGDFGRWPATEANIKEVNRAFKTGMSFQSSPKILPVKEIQEISP